MIIYLLYVLIKPEKF
ncbi:MULTISPECIES: potassium-transporting ATPase subunit F [Bacillaceae]